MTSLTNLKRANIACSVHPTGGSLRVFKQFAWLAITNKRIVNWFSLFVFFTIFLLYGWVALLDTQNKFVITVSQTGIYLPVIWKRRSTVYLPFSSLSAIELIKLRKDTILKLSAGKKTHVISEAYFRRKQDFKELNRNRSKAVTRTILPWLFVNVKAAQHGVHPQATHTVGRQKEKTKR